MRTLLQRFFDRRFYMYRDEIRLRNYRKLRGFAAVGLLFSAVNVLAELPLHREAFFPPAFLGVFGYFAVLFVFSRFFLAAGTKRITPIFYLAQLPLMALAILMGSFMDPKRSAITIMVFLCVMPLCILDVPWRVAAYITGNAAAFAVCSWIAKPRAQFRIDLVNLISFWLIAVAVNMFALTERIESVEALTRFRNKAERDTLTGIYNRGGAEKIQLMLHEQIPGAYLIIDVDHFKQINDTYGHEAGDRVLVALSKVIAADFRTTDVTMRLGGDEFSVYAAGLAERAPCEKKLTELLRDVRAIVIPDAEELRFTISIGCVMNLGQYAEHTRIYKEADACLYRAKEAGRDRFELI